MTLTVEDSLEGCSGVFVAAVGVVYGLRLAYRNESAALEVYVGHQHHLAGVVAEAVEGSIAVDGLGEGQEICGCIYTLLGLAFLPYDDALCRTALRGESDFGAALIRGFVGRHGEVQGLAGHGL